MLLEPNFAYAFVELRHEFVVHAVLHFIIANEGVLLLNGYESAALHVDGPHQLLGARLRYSPLAVDGFLAAIKNMRCRVFGIHVKFYNINSRTLAL